LNMFFCFVFFLSFYLFFFFQAEDGIRDPLVTGVQTCALPIFAALKAARDRERVKRALEALKDAARGRDNVMVPILEASRAYATRSEERRVGKECRSRGAPNRERKKT